MNGFSFHHESSIRLCSDDEPRGSSLIERHPTCRDLEASSINYESSFTFAVFKYIDDILMEENVEEQTCMLQDFLALQATEKSFYDVLGQNYPPLPGHPPPFSYPSDTNPDDYFGLNPSIGFASNYIVDYGSICNQTQLVHCSQTDSSVASGDGENQTPEPVQQQGRRRKGRQSDDVNDMEARRNCKRSVPAGDESEQLDLLSEVMMPKVGSQDVQCPLFDVERSKAWQKMGCNEQKLGPNSRIKHMMRENNADETVDLWSLLIQCSQAVASDDQRSATELLQQIRQNSSQFGNANERLAHYFADGIKARMAGTGTPSYSPAFLSRCSVADMLKAYLSYVTAAPFRKASNFMTNRTIAKLVEQAPRVHVIDFGIAYGFQWPCFIHRQSFRPGGPPKIRITGIELPQPGFRPAERVEETGRRLERVAKECNVPFEYNAIAQKWETIKLEDLRIDKTEVTIVTCMYRLDNLPADTVVLNSPRDTVLKLIKRINPDLFVHGVINGTHNSPFFKARFKEALFHFSAMFDMFEATVPKEDPGRLIFEREVLGRNVMNVIACEGLERVNSPETYRQWQARNLRIGFRQVNLDQKLYEEAKKIVKTEYNKHFVVEKDGEWLLQGWKGKIIHALSFWKPNEESIY